MHQQLAETPLFSKIFAINTKSNFGMLAQKRQPLRLFGKVSDPDKGTSLGHLLNFLLDRGA